MPGKRPANGVSQAKIDRTSMLCVQTAVHGKIVKGILA
jgi:hypothetical protein